VSDAVASTSNRLFLLFFQSPPTVIANRTILYLELVAVRLWVLDYGRLQALLFPISDNDMIPYGKMRHDKLALIALHFVQLLQTWLYKSAFM
jgi:hypothetical protein